MSERTGHRHRWSELTAKEKPKSKVYEHMVRCEGCGVVLEGVETVGERDEEAVKKLKRLGRMP